MVPIIRVDERLLHGQVLAKWVGYHQCGQVVVADETTDADPFLKSLMRASLSKEVRLEICGLERVRQIIETERPERTLVLLRDAEALYRVVCMGAKVEKANFAHSPRDQELPFARALAAQGVQVIIQMVPDSPATVWDEGREEL